MLTSDYDLQDMCQAIKTPTIQLGSSFLQPAKGMLLKAILAMLICCALWLQVCLSMWAFVKHCSEASACEPQEGEGEGRWYRGPLLKNVKKHFFKFLLKC